MVLALILKDVAEVKVRTKVTHTHLSISHLGDIPKINAKLGSQMPILQMILHWKTAIRSRRPSFPLSPGLRPQCHSTEVTWSQPCATDCTHRHQGGDENKICPWLTSKTLDSLSINDQEKTHTSTGGIIIILILGAKRPRKNKRIESRRQGENCSLDSEHHAMPMFKVRIINQSQKVSFDSWMMILSSLLSLRNWLKEIRFNYRGRNWGFLNGRVFW